MDCEQLYQQVVENGYFIIPNFFQTQEMADAKAEAISLLEEDINYRCENSIIATDHNKDGYAYSLTEDMHTMLFPAFRNEKIAMLIEKIITDSTISKLLETIIGKYYRLRADLVRMATGKDDDVNGFYELPHSWHRDTPGEFTFGIFLDDMVAPFSGGTTVIKKGTHFQPYNPVWDFIFNKVSYTTEKHYRENKLTQLSPLFYNIAFFNKLARWSAVQNATEILGKSGDIYFFLNDVWHGRAPNKTGQSFMTIRFGGFPTDFPFKDDLPLPHPHEKLPSTLQARYEPNQPVNEVKDLLIHKTRVQKPNLLYRLAAWEKQVALSLLERVKGY